MHESQRCFKIDFFATTRHVRQLWRPLQASSFPQSVTHNNEVSLIQSWMPFEGCKGCKVVAAAIDRCTRKVHIRIRMMGVYNAAMAQ